jgi:hypothetical protein
MKNKVLFALIILSLSASFAFSQSVVITPKKTTYTRKKPQSEYKKTFTINYPKVKASTTALSKRIEASIDYGAVLGLNLKEELSEAQWLEEADYEVLYNKRGVLCITLSMNGSAAYPSGLSKNVVVDIANGTRVKAADIFTNITGLTTLVRKSQKKEIANSISEIKKDPSNQEPHPETLFKDSKFKAADLEWFSVDDSGVKFHYDYGFPHVIQALQPEGTFFFTWKQLGPYIRKSGLLARLAR